MLTHLLTFHWWFWYCCCSYFLLCPFRSSLHFANVLIPDIFSLYSARVQCSLADPDEMLEMTEPSFSFSFFALLCFSEAAIFDKLILFSLFFFSNLSNFWLTLPPFTTVAGGLNFDVTLFLPGECLFLYFCLISLASWTCGDENSCFF